MNPTIQVYVHAWALDVESTLDTATSFLAFGRRAGLPVVLKVARNRGDEWPAGQVLAAFGGRGTAQVYERTDEAVLLERLIPGSSLVELVRSGRDDEATDILAELIAGFSPSAPPDRTPTASAWGGGFARYLDTGDIRIPADLVRQAQNIYTELCASQGPTRLLHGDLQHYNVLFDSRRGWLAIDPKGVTGELEYELGALFRNPVERPEFFARTSVIQLRLDRLVARLPVRPERVLAWAFAQGVLSAVWSAEDGEPVESSHPGLALARAVQPLLDPA